MNVALLVIDLVKFVGDENGITYAELQKLYPFEEEIPLYEVLYSLMEPYNFKGQVLKPLIKIEENWKPGIRGIECGRYFYREVGEELLKEKLNRVRTFWGIKNILI